MAKRSLLSTCQLCDVSTDFLDMRLFEGHSSLCAVWHLSRLRLHLTPRALQHFATHFQEGNAAPQDEHAATTTPLFVDQDGMPHWHFVPPSVPLVADGFAPELLLIRGLPCRGKSQLAQHFAATHVHVEADHYFLGQGGQFSFMKSELSTAHLWAETFAKRALTVGQNVVVANTFLLNAWMVPYYQIAREVGAIVRVIEMPDRELAPSGRIPLARMQYYRRQWEPFARPAPRYGLAVSLETWPLSLPPVPAALPVFCQPTLCSQQQGERWHDTRALAAEVLRCVWETRCLRIHRAWHAAHPEELFPSDLLEKSCASASREGLPQSPCKAQALRSGLSRGKNGQKTRLEREKSPSSHCNLAGVRGEAEPEDK